MKFRSRIFLQKRVQKKGERERERKEGEKGKILISYKKPVSLPLSRFLARTHVPLLSRQDFIHSSYDVPSPLSIIRFHPSARPLRYLPRETSRDIRRFAEIVSQRISPSCSSCSKKRKIGKRSRRHKKHQPATIDSLRPRHAVVACKQRGLPNLDLRRRSSRTTSRSSSAQKQRGVCGRRWYLDGRPTSDERFPTGAADA